MADNHITTLKHLKEAALRSLAAVTSKVSELTTSVAEALTEMDEKKQDALTFDSVPTSGSSNPVTSGGVYSAMSSILNSATGTSGVKIATGSYVGTGTFGEDNPLSLTFDFAPVAMFIQGKVNSGSTTGHQGVAVALGGCPYFVELTNGTHTPATPIITSWGETVTWWGETDFYGVAENVQASCSADAALNAKGSTYYYLAVGGTASSGSFDSGEDPGTSGGSGGSTSGTISFYYYGDGPHFAPAGMTWEEYIGSTYDDIGELSIDEESGRVYNLDGDLEYWDNYENIGNGDYYVDAHEPIVDDIDVGNMW